MFLTLFWYYTLQRLEKGKILCMILSFTGDQDFPVPDTEIQLGLLIRNRYIQLLFDIP